MSYEEYPRDYKSIFRDFIGIEANFCLDDLALWKCNGCGIVYDGPVHPYTDEPVFIVIDELVKL